MRSRVIICGTRDFADKKFIFETVATLLQSYDDIEIVSGHAKGVDAIAEAYAKEHELILTVLPADWKHYGRAAGPIRNQEMLQYALCANPLVIAFWDGKSKGTANMISQARKAGVKVVIIEISGEDVRI